MSGANKGVRNRGQKETLKAVEICMSQQWPAQQSNRRYCSRLTRAHSPYRTVARVLTRWKLAASDSGNVTRGGGEVGRWRRWRVGRCCCGESRGIEIVI